MWRNFVAPFLFVLVPVAMAAGASSVSELCDRYFDRYFKTVPTRATEAGRHDYDEQLEDLSPGTRASWIDFNRHTRTELEQKICPSMISWIARLRSAKSSWRCRKNCTVPCLIHFTGPALLQLEHYRATIC